MSSGPSAVVVDHDERWAQDFEAIRARLWPVVAAGAIGIEHVGSAAVPGLAAKPVIDVDVGTMSTSGTTCAVTPTPPAGTPRRSVGWRTFWRATGTPTSTARHGWCANSSATPGSFLNRTVDQGVGVSLTSSQPKG
jgi:hypothetical protein